MKGVISCMEHVLVIGLGTLALLVLLSLILRALFVFTVKTQENAIVERFGKYRRVATPGINFRIPFIESVSDKISLRVQQLEVEIESKTKDNVFVTVPVAVQYQVQHDSVVDAHYQLSNPQKQIRSYVFDTVRSALSSLGLDEAFESKDDIAQSVEEKLSQSMKNYGFNIISTLVTDISPDQSVKDSMNSINASQRERDASKSLAEADKIKQVTNAEAQSESMRLHGEGVASQRKAIADGIAEQYEKLRQVGIGNSAEKLLMMTQYFDTLQNVSDKGKSNVLFMPSNPGGMDNLSSEIQKALLSTNLPDDTTASEPHTEQRDEVVSTVDTVTEQATSTVHDAYDAASDVIDTAKNALSGDD